jgi:1,4-alpha-glucan branching enzyme
LLIKLEKADPYAFSSEIRPRTASRIYSLEGYEWNDSEWLAQKDKQNIYNNNI